MMVGGRRLVSLDLQIRLFVSHFCLHKISLEEGRPTFQEIITVKIVVTINFNKTVFRNSKNIYTVQEAII